MKSLAPHELKRRFGNNLSNNEIIINNQNNENLNGNIIENNIKNSKKNSQVPSKAKLAKNILIKKKYKIKKINDIDPQYLEEYLDEIIKDIKDNESKNILNYSLINIFDWKDIHNININNRQKMIESIVYHNYMWRLNPDTVYLAVNILDRYTNITKFKKNEYELAGLAAFFIASKYEDIYCPDAQHISKLLSFKYHYEEILYEERKILLSLDYNLHYISSYKILNLLYYYSDINNIILKYFANMALEFSLTDLNIMKYSQIKRAIGCFILAKKLLGIKSGKYSIKLFFSYDENEMDKIVKNLFGLLKDIILFNTEQNLIAEKYRSIEFNSIFSNFEHKVKEKYKSKTKSKIA